MSQYKVIGLDLAKRKFHLAALDFEGNVVLKKSLSREDFFTQFAPALQKETFAFEACAGCHNTAQHLLNLGHEIIILKTKDVKPYAKSRQKNDINDSIAICKAALDPELMRVRPKTRRQQEITYLHKSRSNVIQQRIQRSNSLMTALQEFGYIPKCGKSQFAKTCKTHLQGALNDSLISQETHDEMLKDAEEIEALMRREKSLDTAINASNKQSPKARILATIPGIGPINASILSTKAMEAYKTPRDFASSLGLVPKQNTTGGRIHLGSITKQGDRYARTMLIQGARSVVIRASKDKAQENLQEELLYQFVDRLKQKGKGFNVICVAVANKLARMAYACVMGDVIYSKNHRS